MILASPSYVNAPGPGDRLYTNENDLFLNAAMGGVLGYVGGKVFGAVASRFCKTGGAALGEIAETSAKSLGDDAADAGMTTVGRWMSEAEYNAMKNGGRVLEGAGGKTSVATGGPNSFNGKPGSVYAEFDVPANSLVMGGGPNGEWFSIIGSSATRSMKFALEKQGGQMLPEFQNLSPILKKK